MRTRTVSLVLLVTACASPKTQTGAAVAKPAVTQAPYGVLANGDSITQYTLTSRDVTVKAISYGAILTEIDAPDRAGRTADIVLGYDSLGGYVSDQAYLGAVVGRYANRIGHAQFTIDGHTYKLAANNGPNALHGGVRGFSKVAWRGEPFTHGDSVGVTFRYTSSDGEEGYPGTAHVAVTYTLAASRTLVVDYEATSDEPTPINLAQHSYFNLHGGGRGTILDHVLTLHASRMTPVDSTLIPTGAIDSVANTPLDFRTPHAIGARIDSTKTNVQLRYGHGYDHNWVLDKSGTGLTRAAHVEDPTTGRTLDIATTEPGVQFYTGNVLDGTIHGKAGQTYAFRSALALETQHFPDSPNHANFPTTIVRPGETFRSRTTFTFGVAK